LVRMCGALTQLQFCQRSRIRDPNQPKRGGPVGSSRRTDARRPVQTDGQQMKQMGLRVDAEHPPKKSPGRAVRTIGFRAQSGCGLNLRVSNIQRVEARDDDRETRRPDLSKTLVCTRKAPLNQRKPTTNAIGQRANKDGVVGSSCRRNALSCWSRAREKGRST
jgi:hypothetical protein